MAALAVDALTALRQAIIAGRDADVVVDGTDLIIEGTRYPGDTVTAFRQSRTGAGYPLMGVWLQWKLRTMSVPEYIKAATTAKTRFVLITDKATLLDYLMGKSEAGDFIDVSKLGMAPPAAVAAGAAAGGAAAPVDEVLTLEAALRKEVAYRTRASVLSAGPNKVRAHTHTHNRRGNLDCQHCGVRFSAVTLPRVVDGRCPGAAWTWGLARSVIVWSHMPS